LSGREALFLSAVILFVRGMRLYHCDLAARARVEFFATFEHLGFSACWLALALALGFAMFYAWDKLNRGWERKQALP